MTKNDFYRHIENPFLLNKKTLSDYRLLVDKYPYCSTIWMLYLKNLQLINSIHFDEKLSRGAVSCSDRAKLFELIHSVEATTVIKKQPTGEISETENSSENKTITPPAKTAEKELPVQPQNTEQATKLDDNLEKEMLKEAVNAAILKEVSELHQEPEQEQKETTPETKENTSAQVGDLLSQNEKHSFDEWIELLNTKTNSRQTKQTTVDNKTSPNIKSSEFDNLIAHFLENEPKIKPQKSEFYSPVNMARISVTEDPELVTETLALIYMQQGNYQKALSAYKKLSLKYPEKNSYFANQIKIIKQKLKK